jgi:predicted metal-dependent HD superfamily phosphohydrolase
MTVIGQAWIRAVHELGGRADLATAAAGELDRAYGAADRSYHGTAHIQDVLAKVALLGAEVGLDQASMAAVSAAACAHDIVYEGKAGEDERASADWALRALVGSGVPASVSRRVHDLVLSTIDHVAPPSDLQAAVLLDADLGILGSDPEGYAMYLSAVRRDYLAVPQTVWRIGRAAVLQTLLDRIELFHTEPARRRWDAPARRNLAAELAELKP